MFEDVLFHRKRRLWDHSVFHIFIILNIKKSFYKYFSILAHHNYSLQCPVHKLLLTQLNWTNYQMSVQSCSQKNQNLLQWFGMDFLHYFLVCSEKKWTCSYFHWRNEFSKVWSHCQRFSENLFQSKILFLILSLLLMMISQWSLQWTWHHQMESAEIFQN